MVESVDYSFKVGARFLIEVMPPKDGEISFNVKPVTGAKTIQVGFLEKKPHRITQDLGLGELLDEIPEGYYKILLEKTEE